MSLDLLGSGGLAISSTAPDDHPGALDFHDPGVAPGIGDPSRLWPATLPPEEHEAELGRTTRHVLQHQRGLTDQPARADAFGGS